jgi:hypothetical protein
VSSWKLTRDGERIAPRPGDPVCSEYDPAGLGAGVEEDGYAQCAGCSWPRSRHKPCLAYDGYPPEPKAEDGHPLCATCGLMRSEHRSEGR